MKLRIFTNLLLILTLFFWVILTANSASAANKPVVRAVLFFSTTCPHCHEVITNTLPPLGEQYGDQLQIVGIDVSQEQGLSLYRAAITRFNIPDNRLGVPTLIVGEVVLVGSGEIPAVFPDLVGKMLAAGGSDWPDIPGLREMLAAEFGLTDDPEEENPVEQPVKQPANRPIFVERFLYDPIANTFAVAVLLGMVAGTIFVGASFLRNTHSKWLLWPKWVLPALALVGLVVALYLSFVEVTHSQAVCGPVGDCNSVQQSVYARLFGVIPIGLMGVAGYIAILIAWFFQEYGPERWRKLAMLVIWGMGWFGVLFSIYLTFLEPFVIGATCLWCITSAIVMTLILLASTESAQQALQFSDADLYDQEYEEDEEDESQEIERAFDPQAGI